MDYAKRCKGDLWYSGVIKIQNLTKSHNLFCRRYKIEKEIIKCNIINTTVCNINNEDWSESDSLISRL